LIKGLVFDFDGLIYDTETCDYAALQWLYGKYGQELSIETWGQCIGTNHEFDPIVHLHELVKPDKTVDELSDARWQYFEELLSEQGPIPGVVSYLERARALDLRIGLASSSPRDWVERYLRRIHLLEFFEIICTADDVERVKPDPALYKLAVHGLGINPNEAVAFEDSPNGALGAKRAGLYCVVIPNGVTRNLSFGDYDLRLDSMEDMELDELILTIMRLGGERK
jgi:HAD superfamily hydrolase (TIGR01509 family)